MAGSIVLAVKATPKATAIINENRELHEKNGEEYTNLDIVKDTWKLYAPSAGMFTASAASLIFSHKVSARRYAMLATAYKISESSLIEYKEKVQEVIGENKSEAIEKKVAEKHAQEADKADNQVILTGGGPVLFLEPVSQRYFKSDIETVRAAVNDINFKMINEMYASLSDFYDLLNIKHTDISDYIGWQIGRDDRMNVRFTPCMADNGREPCISLEYHIPPHYDYDKLY